MITFVLGSETLETQYIENMLVALDIPFIYATVNGKRVNGLNSYKADFPEGYELNKLVYIDCMFEGVSQITKDIFEYIGTSSFNLKPLNLLASQKPIEEKYLYQAKFTNNLNDNKDLFFQTNMFHVINLISKYYSENLMNSNFFIKKGSFFEKNVDYRIFYSEKDLTYILQSVKMKDYSSYVKIPIDAVTIGLFHFNKYKFMNENIISNVSSSSLYNIYRSLLAKYFDFTLSEAEIIENIFNNEFKPSLFKRNFFFEKDVKNIGNYHKSNEAEFNLDILTTVVNKFKTPILIKLNFELDSRYIEYDFSCKFKRLKKLCEENSNLFYIENQFEKYAIAVERL